MGWKIPISVLVVIHTDALDVLLIERRDRPGFLKLLLEKLPRARA